MEELLKQIISKLDILQADVSDIKTQIKSVVDQTADLTEFRTNTTDKLDKIIDDLDFLAHKEQQTEKEVFTIKKKLEIIK